MRALFTWLLSLFKKTGVATSLTLSINGKDVPMSVTLDVDMKVTLSVAPAPDAKGRPTHLDPGVPVWTVSPTAVVSLFPSADGLSCDCGWLSTGTAEVTVSAQAGGKTLTAGEPFTTNPNFATALVITAGAEVPVTS